MKIAAFILGSIILSFVMHFGASVLFFSQKYDADTHSFSWAFPFPAIVEIPAWERKVRLSGEAFKIGLITDTHLDSKVDQDADGERTGQRYMTEIATNQLREFVRVMQEFQPAFITHLGDVIEGTGMDKDVGIFELGMVRDEIAKADLPVYWVIGNHDLRSVVHRNFIEELGQDDINQVVNQGPYRFIFLDTNYRDDGTSTNPLAGDFVPGYVPKETVAWLEGVLDTDKHVYVFAHHSFIPESKTLKNPVVNHEQMRALFAQYNVEAVFGGHIEKRFYEDLDGVGYYVLPGTKKSQFFPGAFYAMTLGEGEPLIQMYFQESEGSDNYIVEDFLDSPFTIEEMERQMPEK